MFFAFFGAYLIILLFLESLQRWILKKKHWSRKASHIVMGLLLFPMPHFLTRNEIIGMASFFTICLIVSKYFNILSLHKVKRKTIGEVLYPLSIALLAIICLPINIEAFQAGCLALAISDGLAGVIGSKFPIKEFRVFGNKKSLGGSLAFAITISIILLFLPRAQDSSLYILIIFIACITLVEYFLIYGLDNLFVPILTALFYIYF